MNQQDKLKKIFEENADFYEDGKLTKPSIDRDTFIRVASEILEEREKEIQDDLKVKFNSLIEEVRSQFYTTQPPNF